MNVSRYATRGVVCHLMSTTETSRGRFTITLDKSGKISQTDRQTSLFAVLYFRVHALFAFLGAAWAFFNHENETGWSTVGHLYDEIALNRQLDVHRIEMTCFYHTLVEPLGVSWGACHFPFCFVYTWFDDRFL